MANAVDVVFIESEAWFVAAVERRHDGILYVGMSKAKRMTNLMHRYLQQICTCKQIRRST